MLKNIEKTIREYLPSVIHMSLATTNKSKPWVCEVHFAYDDNLNLYFMSLSSRRHSKEIETNKYVAGNIVKQHSLNDKPRGIYFEGEAELLKDVTEDSIAFKAYKKRFGLSKEDLKETKLSSGHKFYKIKVKKFYVFDAQESSPSQKYELGWS